MPLEAAMLGEAGRSAEREGQRRHERRREQTLREHPHIGAWLLRLRDDPPWTRAWSVGAAGERRVGAALDAIGREDVVALHDRRIPGKLANIDHVVVGPSGVFVVDTKNYDGALTVRDRGGFFSRDLRLYVGGRDRSKDAAAMAEQVSVVTGVLAARDLSAVAVSAVLCFVGVEWPLLGRPREFAGVRLAQPPELARIVTRPGALSTATVLAVARALGQALRPA